MLSKEASSTIFLSFWYDSTWDWNQVSRAIGEHSNHYANVRLISLVSRMFANSLGDRSSILGRVIPKTKKMVLDTSLLNTQHFKVRIMWSNPGKGVAPFSTPRFSSYWKGSLQVALEYSRQHPDISKEEFKPINHTSYKQKDTRVIQ